MKTKTQIYEKLLKKQGYICPLCGLSLEMDYNFLLLWKLYKKLKRTCINIDIDHKIPKSIIRDAKWKNYLSNLQVTHIICNKRKGKSVNLVV